ncbi:hypothetical protein [Dietzia sp. 179-F 9C3 NHS]|uniref:hypothetical protein n=1 Tax=Dietzia sp. 179-F 9C3 NHS TaxID=3374295 RepID=UPI00387A7087
MTATAMTATETDTPDGTLVDIPVAALSEATSRIDAANRRLARAGIDSRFVYELDYYEQTYTRDGVTYVEDRVRLALNTPALSFGGWTFQASLDIIDGQAIVSTVPGADLSDWQRPDANHCDHCGLNRARTHSYVVRNDDTGELRQIGRTCLHLFLGVRPTGLWAMQWADDALDGLDDRDVHGNGPLACAAFESRQLLALATVVSDRGRQFVSRTTAEIHEKPATADIVWAILRPSSFETPDQRAYRIDTVEAADEVDDADLDAMVASVADLGDSDYAQNLRVLAEQPFIPAKHVALWVSLVGVYFRQQRRKEAVAALPALTGDHLGAEGDKLTDITGTIVTLTSWESDYGYPPKLVTLLVVHTDCGHLLKWQGAVPDAVDGTPLENRQRITISRATVKGHEQYKGQPQTRIVRAKLTRPEESR